MGPNQYYYLGSDHNHTLISVHHQLSTRSYPEHSWLWLRWYLLLYRVVGFYHGVLFHCRNLHHCSTRRSWVTVRMLCAFLVWSLRCRCICDLEDFICEGWMYFCPLCEFLRKCQLSFLCTLQLDYLLPKFF